MRSRVGTPPAVHGISGESSWFLGVAVALALIVVGGIAYLIRPVRRPDDEEPEAEKERFRIPFWQRAVALLAVFAVVLLMLFALSRLGGGHAPLRPVGLGGSGARVQTGTTGGGRGRDMSLDWIVLGAIATLSLAVLVGLAAARNKGGPRPVPEPDPGLPAVAPSGDPEEELDPRRAVLKAYAGMERALGDDGLPRRPTEAPHEYLGRVHAGRRPAGRLTALFERARFSRHEIDEPMRREAIDALAAVRAELERDP
jgi:hypothetical protein